MNARVRLWPECEVIECPLLYRFQGISGPEADIVESTQLTLTGTTLVHVWEP